MRPHFLHNDANYGVNFLNTTTYVSLLSVDCVWFVSRLYHTFIARTNPKTLRGLARALSESALQFYITFIMSAQYTGHLVPYKDNVQSGNVVCVCVCV